MLAAMRLHAAVLALCLVAPGLAGGRTAPPRYHFAIAGVDAVASAPAEVSVKARAILAELLAARPEFVATLDGAPDAKAEPEAFRRWCERRKVEPYAVTVKIDRFDRTLAPNPQPGKSGQLLTVGLDVQLVGVKMPGSLLALAGSGGATVAAEVGARIRPREEEVTRDDALRAALTQAVDAALAELKRPPPKVKAKPRAKR